jgi:hypothetical protein
MTFWGTYLPILAALITWSFFIEGVQLTIHYILSARQAKKTLEFQAKLAEMGVQGELPPMDVLARILSEGQGVPHYGPSYAPSMGPGSGTVSHGQYL